MSIDVLQTVDVIEAMENFLNRRRPSPELREKIDLNYRIENQSVVLYQISPKWSNPATKIEFDIAKATYVKTRNVWKIFWKRADSKWHIYQPKPFVGTVYEFLQLIDEDKHHCFWG